MNFKNAAGRAYCLNPSPIGSGGEGDIFPVQGDGSRVAKIYKSGAVSSELEEKLKIMTMNPPNESVLSQVAWRRACMGRGTRGASFGGNDNV